MAAANAEEVYAPAFYRIPEVPPNVVLDGLAQLKPLLEVIISCRGVSVVSGEPPAQPTSGSTLSLSQGEDVPRTRGWGGVGKTLACIIAARDKNVRDAFPGGAVFLNFGEQVMDADVVCQLRDFVCATGGKSPEGKSVLDAIDEVAPTRTQVARVVGLVADWVEGRRVLFVADILFPRARGFPWANELAKLAESPGGALLYSTRFNDLAEFAPPQQRFVFQCVEDPAVARKIFFEHAGLEQNLPARDAVQTAAVDLILSTCAGWHLALRMAGKIVQLLRYNWALVKENIDKATLVKRSLPSEGGVGVIMSVSLNLLGGLPADGLGDLRVLPSAFDGPDYFEKIYRTLAVLSKVKSVPLSLLPLVFGVADKEAESLASLFHESGLAMVEQSVDFYSGDGTTVGDKIFSLHDLQLQFASDLRASSSVPDASLCSGSITMAVKFGSPASLLLTLDPKYSHTIL